jgi:DNA-binding PucR family transcriptional regulator
LIDARVRAFVEDELASDGPFLETLNAYVEANLNAKLAAEKLGVHVNTAYYRLDRIAERTGQDLRSFQAVLDLVVAVRLLRGRSRSER